MKKKLLFIAPHLSTGGMPQYLYKQIIDVLEAFDVYCIEWDNVTGGVLVVQRNKIIDVLGDRLITLGENKPRLQKIIQQINPDFIHLQEIPEMFMDSSIADALYSTNRSYILIETSHDSSFDMTRKRYFPDKFMMVSKYQIEAYKPFGIPCELIEYPIEYKARSKDRETAIRDLGLDPSLKHVFNVGLFTPRKNQAEIIEYAKKMKDYPVHFHFVGNQADNFKWYWEPIMEEFPSNCTWWGERSDVDIFYEAADLFLFTSRGSNTDKETMPLVIREAISWKTPSLIYNLDVYLNYFDDYKNINYLDFNSLDNNVKKILNILKIDKNNVMKSYDMWSKWDESEQKMYYGTRETIEFPVVISLREYMSNAVMWSADYDTFPKDINFWMVPVSKQSMDYSVDPYFSGIKLCVYKKEDGTQLYEEPHFKKFVNIPRISFSNSVPYYNNYTEFFIKDKYKKYMNKSYKNIVDVGANVGLFTEYFLQKDLCNNIIAVECDPKALKDLTDNFKRDPRVFIIPRALHHNNDSISFYHSEANPVISSVIEPDKLQNHGAGIKGDDMMTVSTITVQDILIAEGTIDLLKIDIEGAEYNIIENLNPNLFKKINNFFIECHFFEADYKEKYSKLINKLLDNGYQVEEYAEGQSDYPGSSEIVYAYKP